MQFSLVFWFRLLSQVFPTKNLQPRTAQGVCLSRKSDNVGRFAVANRNERGEGKPGTFNFLGFTHICGQTRKTGKFLLLRKTIHQRLSTKMSALKEELRRRKHLSVAELGKWLRSVVQGYFNYYAVPGNLASLRSFRLQVIRRWMRALRRRSQKSRMTWPRLVAIADRSLPKASILHPYPNLRFDAKHPR